MKCKKLQNKILKNDNPTLNKSGKNHIAQCPECRQTRDTWEEILTKYQSAEQIAPPPELDKEIRLEARRLVGMKYRFPAGKKVLQLQVRAFSIAAAALLLISGLVWVLRTSPEFINFSDSYRLAEPAPAIVSAEETYEEPTDYFDLWWIDIELELALLEIEMDFQMVAIEEEQIWDTEVE